VRTQSIASEVARVDDIASAWLAMQPVVQALQTAEAGLVASCSVAAVPGEFAGALTAVEANPFFKKTFQQCQHVMRVVEIDKMVATQRQINLDYVETLKTRFEGPLDMGRLVDLCLSPDMDASGVKHLELNRQVHSYTSENLDLRFLGSFAKQLGPDDLAELAERGGIPVTAIVGVVGFGIPSINAFMDLTTQRVILNNGYHRVYALRSLGVTHIPMVLMLSHNPLVHLPDPIGGLQRGYVLSAARPPLFKDYFDDGMTVDLLVKKRLKKVTVQISPVGDTDVPV
jgi:hypothetical protein